MERFLEEARRLFTPSREEEEAVASVARRVEELLRPIAEGFGGRVVHVGSTARGTWLPGTRDIDIFIVLPRDSPTQPEEVVNAVIEAAASQGIQFKLRYAAHPFATLLVLGFEVDVVPAYEYSPGQRPRTPADRSVAHNEYLARRLTPQLAADVRVAKAFMRAVGVYGAEIAVEGFSGYLTELLVIHHGGFAGLIEAASRWRPHRVFIDPEGHYADPAEAARRFGRPPMIVVDPVDPARNAAAAVSLQSLSRFILAAKALLRNPTPEVFRPSAPGGEAPSFLFLLFEHSGEPPDIAWGRFKRAARIIASKLEECGFAVADYAVFSDEERHFLIVYALEALDLPPAQIHVGPPAYSDDALAFAEKYAGDPEAWGPVVVGDRVVVVRRRRIRSAERCVEEIGLKHLDSVVRRLYRGAYREPPLDLPGVRQYVSRPLPWLTTLLKRG